jgi:single-strand DNA-binding protein
MLNLNRHEIIGHVGSDPVLKYTPSGRPVANLSIATTARWKDQSGEVHERTEWHRIVVWGQRGQMVAEHVRRGSYLRVVGPSQTRSWTDRDKIKRFVTEVVAQSVDFLTARAPAETQLPPVADGADDPVPADDQADLPPAGSEADIPFVSVR